MDEDGYPTELELEEVARKASKWGAFDELIDFIEHLWEYPDFGWHLHPPGEFLDEVKPSCNPDSRLLELSTAGWSGNESIIAALQGTMFWMVCWQQSVRGGHYQFIIPAKAWHSDKIVEIPDLRPRCKCVLPAEVCGSSAILEDGEEEK
jgi:hypothetical protein